MKSKKKRKKKSKCRTLLSEKIKQNIQEGKWPKKQAIAIAYSQISKANSKCAKEFQRSRKARMKKKVSELLSCILKGSCFTG